MPLLFEWSVQQPVSTMYLFQAIFYWLLMLRCSGVVPKPRNPDSHNLSKSIIEDDYIRGTTSTQLVNALFCAEIRPPTLQGEPIVVDFSMRVVDINSINVEDMDFRMDMFLKQQWTDARIRIPQEMFEYRDDSITLPSQFFDSLWQPDLYFLSSKVVGESHSIILVYLVVAHFQPTCRNSHLDPQVFFGDSLPE
ncbi:hypothetical protein D910_05693 [Dendroctonus ponderosae]|uniref:Neurotransmitter-gated ion-channel ligand-binding domain-containing protein n=1 Tax=Dendroctonus ponderosae TaxID=77166 RepID=U4UCI6_DENPD|nr:hypothetical protein D910_05693 [Dendroctonus ponderosae]